MVMAVMLMTHDINQNTKEYSNTMYNNIVYKH